MQDFKHIRAWQRAHAMAIALPSFSRGFSRLGHANLRGQSHRAASSIPCSIVGGCGATSNKEFARYLESRSNPRTNGVPLLCARDHHLLSPDDSRKYTRETVELREMIHAYRRKVLHSDRDSNRSGVVLISYPMTPMCEERDGPAEDPHASTLDAEFSMPPSASPSRFQMGVKVHVAVS